VPAARAMRQGRARSTAVVVPFAPRRPSGVTVRAVAVPARVPTAGSRADRASFAIVRVRRSIRLAHARVEVIPLAVLTTSWSDTCAAPALTPTCRLNSSMKLMRKLFMTFSSRSRTRAAKLVRRAWRATLTVGRSARARAQVAGALHAERAPSVHVVASLSRDQVLARVRAIVLAAGIAGRDDVVVPARLGPPSSLGRSSRITASASGPRLSDQRAPRPACDAQASNAAIFQKLACFMRHTLALLMDA
jgi:hypothetical protein